jgi:DNA-directed RNA polymerase subunit alpha
MRVGDRTDFNRLILEIVTDGSISPSEALHKAGNILKDHFERVAAIEFVPTKKDEEKEEEVVVEEKETKKKKK